MSGQLLVLDALRHTGAEPPARPVSTSRTTGPELRFVDQRTFGGMALADLVPDVAAAAPEGARPWGVPSSITHIAADPFEPGLYTWALGIPKGAKNPDGAWKFISLWMTSKDYMRLVGEKLGWARVPPGSRTSTYTDLPEYQAISKSYGPWTLGVDTRTRCWTSPRCNRVPYTGVQFVGIPEFQDLYAGSTTRWTGWRPSWERRSGAKGLAGRPAGAVGWGSPQAPIRSDRVPPPGRRRSAHTCGPQAMHSAPARADARRAPPRRPGRKELHCRSRVARLRALPIAMLATVILLAAVAPVATFAKDPPGLAKFMNAIAKVESGGRYTAQNTSSGAYGKYQIMPSNWPAWARQYLGNAHAPRPPPTRNGSPPRSSAACTTGWDPGVASRTGGSPDRMRPRGWSASARLYVDKVMTAYKGASSTMPTAAKAKPKAKPASRPATSARPAPASRTAAAGTTRARRVRRRRGPLLDQGRRHSDGQLHGNRITWYGPVGPTRGKARILVDGVAVRTVDLHNPGFKGHAALFSRTWKAKGAHTLTIQVLGTKRHPMVAIDEFVVRG